MKIISVFLTSLSMLMVSKIAMADPVLDSATAIYDTSDNLLQIDVVWSGFDTTFNGNGVKTLSFDTDTSPNPFTFGVTSLISSNVSGATLISNSGGIGAQALIVDLPTAITSAGSNLYSFVFSGVSSTIIGTTLDLGGNWDAGFGPLSAFIPFQPSFDEYTVVSGDVVISDIPVPAPLALIGVGLVAIGLARRKA